MSDKKNEKNRVWPAVCHAPFILLASVSESGKTTLLRHLEKKVYNKSYNDIVHIGPGSSNYPVYSDDLMRELLAEHNKERKKNKRYKTLFIIDDCNDSPDLKLRGSEGVLNLLASRGRHMNVSVWISTQNLKDVSPCIRSNCNAYVVFSKSSIGSIIDSIADDFYFTTRKHFRSLFTHLKNPYDFLLIDKINMRVIIYDSVKKRYSTVYSHFQ